MQPSPLPGLPTTQQFVRPVVQQHVEETAHLRQVRSALIRAPHVELHRLTRLDERIAAHVDGMVVSAAGARQLALQELDPPSTGKAFAMATLALLTEDQSLLNHVTALAVALPEAARGVASALGWVDSPVLRGVVRDLLASPQPVQRRLGIQACALHRIDPGPALSQTAREGLGGDAALRTAALQAAAALGRMDLVGEALQIVALSGDDLADIAPGKPTGGQWPSPEGASLAFAAAALACRGGQVRQAWPLLERLSGLPGDFGLQALHLALSSAHLEQTITLARHWSGLARSGTLLLARRRAIQSAALHGDPRLVPWLIEQMADAPLSRLAGEAFTWITGADLAALDLETLDPPGVPEHPNDDSDDDSVALDEDESLPWPDVPKLQHWWATNAGRWASAAAPVFMGHPAQDKPALLHTLHWGKQRQRRHAAWLLGLQSPRQPLFAVSAPAQRQMALLARFTG